MDLRDTKTTAGIGAVLLFFTMAMILGVKPHSRGESQPVNMADVQENTSAPLATKTISSSESVGSKDRNKAWKFDEGILTEIINAPTPMIQQDLLYSESQKYIALTAEEADKVARRIAFLDGRNESASLACGPLSIAILRDAKLLPSDASVRKIWLLCPREREDCSGLKTLQQDYFPPAQYEYLRVTESVRTYDFISNPLQPGDWMYLFAITNGYDHMLTVTRVNCNGAAYTVTNINRGNGFIIAEALLYDPNSPGQGLFYELTDPARGDLGMCGTGGFLLVRKKDPDCPIAE